MVKGTTRQVVVVKGAMEDSFDQAIFLVRDEIISKGGISEDALLNEARQACQDALRPKLRKNMLWSLIGAAFTGFLWLLSRLL